MKRGLTFTEVLVIVVILSAMVTLFPYAVLVAQIASRIDRMRSNMEVPQTPEAAAIVEELVGTVEVPADFRGLGVYEVYMRIPHERYKEVTGGMVQKALLVRAARWAEEHYTSLVFGDFWDYEWEKNGAWNETFCTLTFALEPGL